MRRNKRIVLILTLLPILAWSEQIWTDFSPKPEVVEIVTDDTASVSEVLTEVNETIVETKTEDLDISSDYNALLSNLNKLKLAGLDINKDYLLELLTEEIVKRYVYREGLYEYFKQHDPEIKKATEILGSPTAYLEYLR